MKITSTEFRAGGLRREESLFHTANGYLGVRGNFEEGYPDGAGTVRGTYINGFYDIIDINYPEKLYGFPETAQRMVNLPDMQTTKIYFGDEEFSLFEGKNIDYERTLDMDAGTSSRKIHWRSPNGLEARVSFTRMASFSRPELFLTAIEIERVSHDCELKIVSEADCGVYNFSDKLDPRVASVQERYIHINSVDISGKNAAVLCHTSKSGLSVAAAMGHSVDADAAYQTALTPNGFATTITIKPGKETVTILKYCAYSDSRRHDDCKKHALDTLDKAVSDGADILFAEQTEYLSDFWDESGVTIHGDDKVAEGMAFNLYCLLQSAGRDRLCNIAAKGLSGEGYEGHYFWDTEIYMFPFFLMTRPKHAKILLGYRYSILDSAREHARILGHKKGALYSWRTITGSECSPYYPSGSAQYHITGDVAHSFLQYYHATKDLDFMLEAGAEVLVETARLWLDAGVYDRQGRLCFNDVTGPDEYTCIVNNNYFTNLSAKHNLNGAVYICGELEHAKKFKEFADKLGLDNQELKAFEKAASDIYIPYDADLDVNPQDDSFLDKEKWDLSSIPKENFPLLMHYHPLCLYRGQVCKQADTVLAHFLYDDADESTVKNSYNYYEAITTHDSTLSKCVFSIMASKLGMPEKAYEYFLDTVRTDLDDTHGNTRDGLHTANMGGAYLAVVAGFAGLRVKDDGIHFSFTLPKAWSGYDFCLNYQGRLIHVSVSASGVCFILKNGEPVTLYVDGVSHRVSGVTEVNGVVR